jgi:hypothetical protein
MQDTQDHDCDAIEPIKDTIAAMGLAAQTCAKFRSYGGRKGIFAKKCESAPDPVAHGVRSFDAEHLDSVVIDGFKIGTGGRRNLDINHGVIRASP